METKDPVCAPETYPALPHYEWSNSDCNIENSMSGLQVCCEVGFCMGLSSLRRALKAVEQTCTTAAQVLSQVARDPVVYKQGGRPASNFGQHVRVDSTDN
jgi:hypothetical protein